MKSLPDCMKWVRQTLCELNRFGLINKSLSLRGEVIDHFLITTDEIICENRFNLWKVQQLTLDFKDE